MTPINFIIIFFLIQVIGYIILDKFNLKKLKYLLLIILLIVYIFYLPNYFYPKNPNNKPICGMPILAINLTFWIIGCGSTLLTHFAYTIIINDMKKQ